MALTWNTAPTAGIGLRVLPSAAGPVSWLWRLPQPSRTGELGVRLEAGLEAQPPGAIAGLVVAARWACADRMG